MWPLQSPQPGKYLPPLAWPWPVGGEKNLVLNVTALRAQDVSWRQETPGPGSQPACAMGTRPPGEEAQEGLLGSKTMEIFGKKVLLPLPRGAAGPFPACRGAGRCHCHTVCLVLTPGVLQGQKNKENYKVLAKK